MTALLVIIYIAFISLGLPDSLLGSAWPAMHADLNAPLPLAGYLSMFVAVGTVISSLFSNRMIARFGTGKVTAVSVLMTALGLLGISMTRSTWPLFLFSLPLGIGAGAVDSALNNFVALHYEARHMSWLHCFWGLGATAGPMLVSFLLARNGTWRDAYRAVSGIQFAMAIVMFASIFLWKQAKSAAGEDDSSAYVSNRDALKLPYVIPALLNFLFFCAVEGTCGLWAASYLNITRGMNADSAAAGASMFYAFITIGRIISGFITMKVSSTVMIRLGQCICLLGAVVIALPLPASWTVAGIAIVGFGTSPIYPCMIHETPRRFGAKNSQAVVGLQSAFAYGGTAVMPSLFGSLASFTGMGLYPWYIFFFTLVMLILSEYVAKKTSL